MTYVAVNPETIVVTSFLIYHCQYMYVDMLALKRIEKNYSRASPLEQLTAGMKDEAVILVSISSHTFFSKIVNCTCTRR